MSMGISGSGKQVVGAIDVNAPKIGMIMRQRVRRHDVKYGFGLALEEDQLDVFRRCDIADLVYGAGYAIVISVDFDVMAMAVMVLSRVSTRWDPKNPHSPVQ